MTFKQQKGLALMLALIPSTLGLLSFVNNLQGYQGTMKHVITPLLSMQHVPEHFTHFRAIHYKPLMHLAYLSTTLLELIVSLTAISGMIVLLKAKSSLTKGISRVQAACFLGLFIWGFIFFTLGGDFFLSWKSESLKYFARDALNYVILCFVIAQSLETLKPSN